MSGLANWLRALAALMVMVAVTLLGLLAMTFVIGRLVPIDPVIAVVGDKEQVKQRLQAVLDETVADELIIASQIFDQGERLRSYELIADVRTELRKRIV